ncbi:AfsR/SARP family transcriptional regulator [Yinghuangia soli]|uniref:AfsR/SARP family transcriptional regulator n=1 Tax=Yinghuangia soli TaxID=2908204 RepID=UPI00228590A8|nr:BTAD domain-containing putative transcriptional regulator [Yinghuangia soli]
MLFGILGPVEAHHADGTEVAVGGPRVRSLLALLLLDAGRIVPTETLVDGLYGENPPGDAANALQSQISRLRRGLRDDAGTDKLVEFHAAGYRLSVDREQVDAHRFDRLVRAGRQALALSDHAGAERLLDDALGLWRGPAFADVIDAPFAPGQAAAWEELRLEAFADRAEAQLLLGRHQDALPELRRLAAEHPLRERFVGQLMRALYASGRQAEALAAYEETRTLLADELGTDPSAELAAVHLDILRAAPTLIPAPAAPAAAPSTSASGTALIPSALAAPGPEHVGLPVQLTSFVGREAELERVAALLGSARLVTLTGPGGTGKTRLSVETGRRTAGDVCFVDLAPVRHGGELVQAMLAALGLREGGLAPGNTGNDGAARLFSGLASREILLILDNCEQIVADVARLAHQLLNACPGVQVLATSREALGITGEMLCPVPRLALPADDAQFEEAIAAPVVRLFADRAAAVRPDFAVDAVTLPTVLGICGALDGLPLAVELAAARLRALPLEEIAARLDDRFRLLSRGNRTAAPRHQTLRAVVEWSWELLDDAEQELARRLTVFPGGATIESAAQVCGLPDDEVVELLADLADKSLVEGNGGRYRMSETVRLYGSERLDEAGERAALERAHAEYFLALAERAEPYLRTGEQLVWLDRLSAELANLRSALRWATGTDPNLGLRLNAALAWFWWLRGLRHEAGVPAHELLLAVGDEPPAGLIEEYLFCLLCSLAATTDPDDEQRAARLARAQPLLFSLPGPPRQPVLFVIMGMALGPERSDTERTMALMGDDAWSHAVMAIGYGFTKLYGGDLPAAGQYFEDALTRFRVLGDRWGIANAIDQLAVLTDWAGDIEGGLALMDESFELMRQLGITADIDDLQVRRAEMLVRLGDRDGARATYERVMVSATRTGRPSTRAVARAGLGELARLDGAYAEAKRLQEQALAECPSDSFDSEGSVAGILTALAWTSVALDDPHKARGLAQAAMELTYTTGNLMVAADAISAMAGAALHEGEAAEAAVLLGLAASTRGAEVPGHVDVMRVAAGARDALGEAAYDAAYARGNAVERGAAPAHLVSGRMAGI